LVSVKSFLRMMAFSVFCFSMNANASPEEHAFHHNHVAAFLGATMHDSHFYPTVGADYEYFFNSKSGVVALAELVFADHLEQIGGLGLAYHPIPSLKIAALGGLEYADGHSAFLMRGNLEYGIHAGPLTISPSFSVDYVSSEILYVFGATFGMVF